MSFDKAFAWTCQLTGLGMPSVVDFKSLIHCYFTAKSPSGVWSEVLSVWPFSSCDNDLRLCGI